MGCARPTGPSINITRQFACLRSRSLKRPSPGRWEEQGTTAGAATHRQDGQPGTVTGRGLRCPSPVLFPEAGRSHPQGPPG